MVLVSSAGAAAAADDDKEGDDDDNDDDDAGNATFSSYITAMTLRSSLSMACSASDESNRGRELSHFEAGAPGEGTLEREKAELTRLVMELDREGLALISAEV